MHTPTHQQAPVGSDRLPVDDENIELLPLLNSLENEHQRKIIEMRLRGMAYPNIATQLNMNEAAVRKTHERGVAMLRQMYQNRQRHSVDIVERFQALWGDTLIDRYNWDAFSFASAHPALQKHHVRDPAGSPAKLLHEFNDPASGMYMMKGTPGKYHGDHPSGHAIFSMSANPKMKYLVPKHLLGS